ncbi:hypothetical protein SAMN05421595_2771 [Austwickia chelonae]|uniref:Uncharacterized protein n=1 Tax=Austwickia chelonae NBRC 105200 TaxID=1184607 RepID=K6VT68_9MICO|nr:hypothetical protein [Austwickia chelonae]GAB78500.1 hypothetical protein AUCHE_09_01050 [Austwickia chelonae NBRC 105200]SEW40180.1 hypothetical protein SAMN05421595_2771 [Austwickia chelonae]
MSSTVFSVAATTLALSASLLATPPASASTPSMAPQAIEAATLASRPSNPLLEKCPSGHACLIDPSGNYNNFYKYGSYNLTDVHGDWIFCNNQTGGARVNLHFGLNGTGGVAKTIPAGECHMYGMTPVNSFTLAP